MTEGITEPVIVALGSNLGDTAENLDRAIALIRAWPQFEVTAVASYMRSAPMYVTDQPEFLNTVLMGRARCSPEELLTFLKSVEEAVGREKTFRNGPRVIDLDIIYFGDLVLDGPSLTIPHPRRLERDFVLVPLAELAPGLSDPETGRPVAAHLADLREKN